MEIYYEHYFGSMTQHDMIVCWVLAENVLPQEEKFALENGWREVYETEQGVWVQARSVRLKTSSFRTNKKIRRMLNPATGIESNFKPASQCNLEELNEVYHKYAKYKNFPIEKNYIEDCLVDIDSKIIGEHREDGLLRAYVICRMHDESAKAMTSLQFCWDYDKPQMFLGKFSMVKELQFAIENKLDWVYIGDGYQKICEYKCSFPGFQFWTGRKWISDINLYKELIKNDDKVKTINDLDKLAKDYMENKTFEK